jgi:hypothetical protein
LNPNQKELKSKLKYILPFICLIILLLVLATIKRGDLQDFLSKTMKIDADVLVVEGWLPDKAIEVAVDEIKTGSYDLVITTGTKSPEIDFCLMGMNGYLIFYPKLNKSREEDNAVHKIEVVAKSKMGGTYSCHFNLFINNTRVADFTADNKSRKYGVNWSGSLNDIDSVMVQFDNDMVDKNGDRNFFVKEIIFDDSISVPYKYNSVYNVGKMNSQERFVNNYETLAEYARNKLIRLGIDPSKVLPLSAGRTRFNRTLSSVLAFRQGLETERIKYTDFNVITLSLHARRTWMTYKSVLNKSFNIGIITIPEPDNKNSENNVLSKVLIEYLDLIYYYIILVPFRFGLK